MNIPIFKLQYSKKQIKSFLNHSENILKSGFVSESTYVNIFEKNFSKLFNIKNSIFVGSGTDALEIAFKATNRNKKIILQSNNFFAAHVALENSNKEAIYCDMELETLGIDPNHLEYLLKKNRNNIDAICIVHTGGIISKYIEEIIYLSKKFNVSLIEDAAHATGSHKDHKYAGTFGDIGCFSFFPTKVMTTGEGGMVTFNNKKFLDVVKSLKNFGRSKYNSWVRIRYGSNCKVTEFQALLGIIELNRVKKRIKKRNKIAKKYFEIENSTDFQVFKPFNSFCSFYKIFFKYDGRKIPMLERFFQKKNISLTGKVWPYPLHKQFLYRNKKGLKLPNTDYFVKNHFCPPIYPELTNLELDFILKNLKDFNRLRVKKI